MSTNYGFNYEGGIADGLLLLFTNGIVGYVWNKMYKRSIIRDYSIKFDTSFRLYEDENFSLQYMSYCKNMVSTDTIGYFYHEPHWSVKYKGVNNLFILYQSEYESYKRIYKGKNTLAIDYCWEMFTKELFSSFVMHDNAMEKLRIYKSTLGQDVLFSRMFFCTKWVIYLDPTCILSYIIVLIHSKIGEYLRNKRK